MPDALAGTLHFLKGERDHAGAGSVLMGNAALMGNSAMDLCAAIGRAEKRIPPPLLAANIDLERSERGPMRTHVISFLKRLLGIHHQSGVEPLASMRTVGWRRHSYWVPEGLLGPESVCYCIGAGEDISFDVELRTNFGCQVFIFDPTPYGINHFAELERHVEQGKPFSTKAVNHPYTYDIDAASLARITFVPTGVWDRKTVLKFHDPQQADYASFSACLFQDSDKVVEAPVDRLANLMAELGHRTIDLVKIEIEGAEYRVIETIIEDRLDIKAILVEFDEVYHPRNKAYHFRVRRACSRLRKAGYVLVHSTPNFKRTFLRRDIYDRLRARSS
ncbi:FkbM family methyltransferase [Dokdonella sp.]|uniref:FkbM family methyltransferase n=1 Tax=Dokdonella sp. TaxID=2291710 RepID=UPI003F808F68